MQQDAIELVQASFRNVVPLGEKVGVLFYHRLFETHPELRPMFAEDIQPQARKLVQMLALVVNSLHKLDTIMPAVIDLARRHKDYGVVDAHYPVVGETLIWTLEQGLGATFTSDVKRAWIAAFDTLSSVMIAVSKTPPASR